MSGATLLDTETTGITDPEVIELAFAGPFDSFTPVDESNDSIQCLRFKPSKPISLGALATHHILDEDLAQETPWPGQWVPPGDYLVGHKIDFDWEAIGSPPVKRICTLALARALWPDLDSHSLSALTYHFVERHEARELLRSAHDATRDVELCARLLRKILEQLPAVRDWEQLWQASEHARVPVRFTFGKYGPQGETPGRLISEIRIQDPGYIRWCLGVPDFAKDQYLSRALRGQA